MGKSTEHNIFDEEESKILRHKKIKKESRHNFRDHLKHMVEEGDWDGIEEETYEHEHSDHFR